MGTFNVDVTFFNVTDRSRSTLVHGMMVDTGADATWVPKKVLEDLGVRPEKKTRAYTMANGQTITRPVGFAIIELSPAFYTTVDEVIFAEDDDQLLLGARALEGLGVRVDPEGKQLVASGPQMAAGNRRASVQATSTSTTPNSPSTD